MIFVSPQIVVGMIMPCKLCSSLQGWGDINPTYMYLRIIQMLAKIRIVML